EGPRWATGATSPGERLVMQGDGNLVVYNAANVATWQSGTAGNPGSWLALQHDGNLVVYDAAGKARWWIPPLPPTGGVSVPQLRAIMPNLSVDRANAVLPHLNKASEEAGINTPKRQAAFLAQLAHESGEFRYFEELASGAAYEGRVDLGNIHPGDGVRYKGRGPIQLTGRSNYRAAGRALGIDLEGNPKRAADLDVGFRTAAWFWNSRNLSPLADQGNFREITRRINGGYTGLASRERYYARARQVLGA
ncbi:MAG TPA: glycoside hydrolase family 19 protein, partial [Myxococcus sp.]|nr:glycoside hydrolase family 19 protein [Myxococcus sp.]